MRAARISVRSAGDIVYAARGGYFASTFRQHAWSRVTSSAQVTFHGYGQSAASTS
jgi:hypothetical protein